MSDILTMKEYAALPRPVESIDTVKQRGFSSAVGPYNSEYFAFCDLQAYII